MTDLELLHRCAKEGDQQAFGELVRRHSGWVHATAMRLTADLAMSEDITQAVFILLSRKARSLRERLLLSNWLFTVVRYCASNAIRDAICRRKHERQAAAMRNETVPESPE